MHEIQRLRVENSLKSKTQHSSDVPYEKGNLKIKDIAIPLKKEYVRALSAGEWYCKILQNYEGKIAKFL